MPNKNTNANSLNALGTINSAFLSHANIPSFSMGGQNSFTIETSVLLQSDASRCIIYGQDSGFSFGIDAGKIFFSADGFCKFTTDPQKLKLSEEMLYYLCLRYDVNDKKLKLFLQGYEILSVDTTTTTSMLNTNSYKIGAGQIGGITRLHVFLDALTDKQIFSDFLNPTAVSDNAVCWFDFDTNGDIMDKSKNHLAVTPAMNVIVCNYAATMTFSGVGCATTGNAIKTAPDAYSLVGKIFPNFTTKNEMVIYSSAQGDNGFTLSLIRQVNYNYLLVFSSAGKTLISTKEVTAQKWLDFAFTYANGSVTLFIDGEVCGQGALTVNLAGPADVHIGAEANTKGMVVYTRGYSGYMAYLAEFSAALTAAQIAVYIDNPPYIFDMNIMSVFTLNTPNAVESTGSRPIMTSGDCKFAYAVATQSISAAKGVSYFFPAVKDPVWDTLTPEVQWKLKYFCTSSLIYVGGVAGINYGNKVPDALTLSQNGASALIKAGVVSELVEDEYNNNNKAVAIAVIMGAVTAVGVGVFLYMTSTTLAALGAGFVPIALAGITGIGEVLTLITFLDIVATALAAGLLIAATVYMVIRLIELNADRPNNTSSAIKINSITMNFGGDAAQGCIHSRRNRTIPIEPTVQIADGVLNYVGVIVPQKLTSLKITVNVTADAAIKAVLKATDNGDMKAFTSFAASELAFTANTPTDVTITVNCADFNWKKQPFLQKLISQLGWNFRETGKTVDIFIMNTTQTLYTLLGLPPAPWDSSTAAYSADNLSYVWTDLLDICVTAYADYPAAAKTGTPADHLSAYTTDLNSCGAFVFDSEGAEPHFSNYNDSILATDYLEARAKFKSGAEKSKVNSTDCASLVVLEGLASGIKTAVCTINAQAPQNIAFNYVKLIGFDEWTIPFNGGPLFHDTAVLADEMLSPAVKIFDASLKIDSGGYPGDNTHTKTAFLPVNYAFAPNTDVNVNVPATTAYTGQFYRERLVKNGTTCEFEGKYYILAVE
jgi:hypothetical protein